VITIDFKKLRIKAGYRILDIGCGTGRHTCAAAKFNKTMTTGVDIHLGDVIEARNRFLFQEKLGENNGRINFSIADITHLPFYDNFFDLVICSEVLEHIPDQTAAISEMTRVLKPNKNVVISVPRYWPERLCWALSKEYHTTEKGHLRIYRKKALVALLNNASLKHWASHWAHSIHTPYWWLKCLVGPSRKDSKLVNLYHRFLIWDIMGRPWITRFLDNLFNPLLGKSIVLYLRNEK